MIDLNVNIFITIGLDCCNRVKGLFTILAGVNISKGILFFNICNKKFRIVVQKPTSLLRNFAKLRSRQNSKAM